MRRYPINTKEDVDDFDTYFRAKYILKYFEDNPTKDKCIMSTKTLFYTVERDLIPNIQNELNQVVANNAEATAIAQHLEERGLHLYFDSNEHTLEYTFERGKI